MILFRLPHETEIYTLSTTDNPDFSIVFFDFYQERKFDFQGKKRIATQEDFQTIQREFLKISILKNIPIHDDFQSYSQKISEIQRFLQEKKISKLVLSRRKYIEYSHKTIDIVQSFQKMCASYPDAFVYLFVEDDVAWQGGFYEILGKIHLESGLFETMSLAGTLPIGEEWTEKERVEQEAVTQYVEEVLGRFSDKFCREPLQDVISGNIKHLHTAFKANIQTEDFAKLIQELHPTPAVCGMPKSICKIKIEQMETGSRDLYAGYIYLSDMNMHSCYVNLRCAQLYPNAVKIFAGGGINSQSDAIKEWKETELKSQAILKNLQLC